MGDCLKCKERKLGCHSECEKYFEYKRKLEIIRLNRSKHRESYYYLMKGR